MPSYHFYNLLTTAVPHTQPWNMSLIALYFNKKHSTSEESWAANLTFFSAKVRNFTDTTKEGKACKKWINSQRYILYKRGQSIWEQGNPLFQFLENFHFQWNEKNCFLSLEKTVGSVDHDRTVASYISKMKRKGYDTSLCTTGSY